MRHACFDSVTLLSALRSPAKLALALAAVVLCAACAAPPAEEDVVEPKPPPPPSVSGVDVNSSTVPPDLDVPKDATTSQIQRMLGQFAWQEFVALNWPSNYTATSPTRGEPSTDPSMTFVSVTTQTSQPLVWQTYKHRVEVYPQYTKHYDKSFDTPPEYAYSGVEAGSGGVPKGDVYHCTATGSDPNGIPLSQLNSAHANPDYFNNLDETSEINLCTMFVDNDPAAPPELASYMNEVDEGRRFIYQAKANDQMFKYVASSNLFDFETRWTLGQTTFQAVTEHDQGGVAPCPEGVLCFPPGQSGGTEGTLEVKATWRHLTQEEYDSGRFLIGPILRYYNYDPDHSDAFCYQIVDDTPTENTLPYGVAGLHIIHKTTNFPTFVFATFEQVDNLDPTKQNSELFYYNCNTGIVNPGKQIVISRAHPVQDAIETLNSQVHQDIRARNPDSVWQYYKLIGVQGSDIEFSNDNNFYLANIVTETNQALRSFSGSLDSNNGIINPKSINVYRGDQTFTGGGCKGCHGNAQAGVALPPNAPNSIAEGGKGSFDFSFITANALFDGIPDAVNQPLLKDQPNWYDGPATTGDQ